MHVKFRIFLWKSILKRPTEVCILENMWIFKAAISSFSKLKSSTQVVKQLIQKQRESLRMIVVRINKVIKIEILSIEHRHSTKFKMDYSHAGNIILRIELKWRQSWSMQGEKQNKMLEMYTSRWRQTLFISTVGTPLQRTLQTSCLLQWECISSNILWVNPSLPE